MAKVIDKKEVGRPSKYKPKYIKMVDVYLSECQDEEKQVTKQVNEGKGYEMFENKLTVNLPTLEGFALFIGVSRNTLWGWKDNYPEFSSALDKITVEQQKRLLNKGLSGDYNPTIAKLILSANHGMREKSDVTTDDKPITSNVIVVQRFSEDEEENKTK